MERDQDLNDNSLICMHSGALMNMMNTSASFVGDKKAIVLGAINDKSVTSRGSSTAALRQSAGAKMVSLLLLIAALASCATLTHAGEDRCSLVQPLNRVDCHPDGTPDEASCQARGCCWMVEPSPPPEPREPGVPSCFYANDFVNYDITHKTESESRILLMLERKSIETGFPENVDSLMVEVTGITNDTLRVRITDTKNKRWEVPEPVLNIDQIKSTCTTDQVLYDAFIDKQSLVVRRRSNQRIIFSIDLSKIIYSNQYIALPFTSLPASTLHGLGERRIDFTIDFTKSFKRLVLYTRDSQPVDHLPTYGSHPFYVMREAEGSSTSHGVLFFNNNAAEVTLMPSKSFVYRTIGGIIDFFVFLGPDVYDVISTKNKLIGLPTMPPLWSMGFHLCRSEYKSATDLNDTFHRNKDAGLPIDVQWVDSDYKVDANDFTLNNDTFSTLPAIVDQLHAQGVRFVPIIDPAIPGDAKEGTYPPYDLGKELDIFIKKQDSEEPFAGRVWNRVSSIWPDFSNPASDLYWTELMSNLHKIIPFDGVWIDMNEPAAFTDGELGKGCQSIYDQPPYDPLLLKGTFLWAKTICLSARQQLSRHYDLHSMYGYYEAKRTFNALESIFPRKRQFILSRSSVTGLGKYAAHWTGDIGSSWEDLRQSINDIQAFNLYGIPNVGADTCGFFGSATPEMCARWSALGAFYPFSRNHNSGSSPNQDPAALGPDVVAAAKYALNIRYQLIPYMYTLFYQASTDGLPFIRSLTLEYPHDVAAATVQNQFLIGPNIMISPVVDPDVTQVTPYFPASITWLDFVSRKRIIDADAQDRRVTLPCNLTEISVTIREGAVVPTFTSPKENLMKTARESGYTLYVVPDSSGHASGRLFADSGDEPIESPSAKNSYISFSVNRPNETAYIISSQPLRSNFASTEGQANFRLDRIFVLNPHRSDYATLMTSAILSRGNTSHPLHVTYYAESNSYLLDNMSQDLNQHWTITLVGW